MAQPEDEDTKEQPVYSRPSDPAWPDDSVGSVADGTQDPNSPAQGASNRDTTSEEIPAHDAGALPDIPAHGSPEATPEATMIPDPPAPGPPVATEPPSAPQPPFAPDQSGSAAPATFTPAMADAPPPASASPVGSVADRDEQTTTMLPPVPPASAWGTPPAQPPLPPPAQPQVQAPPPWQQPAPTAGQQWQQPPQGQWQQPPQGQWQQPAGQPWQQQQPGWPQQPTYAPPPGYVQGQAGWSAEPSYATSAFAAVAGLLLVIFGLAVAAIGAWSFTQGPEIGRFIRDNDVAVFGTQIDRAILRSVLSPMPAIMIVLGIVQLLSGAGVIAHKGWARALGLVLALLGLLVALFAVSLALALAPGASVPVIIAIVLLIGYAFVVLALIAGGSHFQRRYPPAR